jgi:hypothetical protein
MSDDHMMEEDEAGGGRRAVEETVYAVSVGSVKYAVGLFWNEVDDPSQGAVEARRIAARPTIDADLFCLRARGDQYGLGKKADGQQKNMPALAGHLADSRGGSWLGLFEIDAGFYLVSVVDDMITTDAFFPDEMDARTKFEDVYGMQDWAEVFCPAAFDIPDTKPTLIADIVSGRAPRLQDVDRVSSALKLGLFGVVLVVIFGGGAWYYKSIGEQEAAEQLRIMQELARKARPGGEEAVQMPPTPWENKFKGVDYLKACDDAMKKAVLDIPGWRSTELSCNNGESEVVMRVERQGALDKGGGTINWVRWALDKGGMRDAKANPTTSADVVEVRWTFPPPERWKPAEGGTYPVMDMRRYLQSQFEELFTVTSFKNAIDGGGDPKAAKAPVVFKSLKFGFESPYVPQTFSEILGRLPGLFVTKVSLDLKKLVYQVEGQVNEQIINQPVARKPQGQPADGKQDRAQNPGR